MTCNGNSWRPDVPENTPRRNRARLEKTREDEREAASSEADRWVARMLEHMDAAR